MECRIDLMCCGFHLIPTHGFEFFLPFYGSRSHSIATTHSWQQHFIFPVYIFIQMIHTNSHEKSIALYSHVYINSLLQEDYMNANAETCTVAMRQIHAHKQSTLHINVFVDTSNGMGGGNEEHSVIRSTRWSEWLEVANWDGITKSFEKQPIFSTPKNTVPRAWEWRSNSIYLMVVGAADKYDESK